MARTPTDDRSVARAVRTALLRPWLPAVLICLALGLIGLGERPLWYDERVTARLVTGDWDTFARRVLGGDQVFGALHYVVLRGWSALGADPFMLRLPSLIFAAATIPVAYRIGRDLFGSRVAFVASLLLATQPIVIRYAQEARAYALALFLTTLATYLLLRALRGGGWDRLVAYGLAAGAAVLAHLFSGLVLVVHFVAVLLRRPLDRRAVGTVASVGIVMLPFVLVVGLYGPTRDFIPEMTLPRIRAVGDQLAGGFGVWPPVHALAYAGFGTLAIAAWRPRRAAWLCAAWLLVPVALAVAVSVVKPVLLTRYLIVVLPAAVLLVAAGIELLRPHDARVGALVFVGGLAALGLVGLHVGRADL